LVVGLGNPGPRYVATRHNIGFRILECFGRQQGIALLADRFFGRYGSGRVGDLEVGLLAPQIFMNRSGQAVSAALRAFPELDPAADLLVLYDDLDLPLGRIRLRPAGGVGGHRGMADVADEIATREFPRPLRHRASASGRGSRRLRSLVLSRRGGGAPARPGRDGRQGC
jgi:PTH1 family peptidyl-tRNA hydrolase